MSVIKKSSFFRNRSFNQKNRFKMQSYLNEMSANGLHISKIERTKCYFGEDASVRYLYSICGSEEDGLYTEESGWVHFCNYKGIPFYKRAVPTDAVKLVRDYKKKHIKQEKSWLNARLKEGLSLIGKIGNEYIFQRTKEYTEYEYVVRRVKKARKTKDGDSISPLGNTNGLIFLTTSDDGAVYYFIKDETAKNSIIQNRGKRLSDQIFSIFTATGAALAFCASAFTALFGLIRGGGYSMPLLIGGSCVALVSAVVFGIYFKKFQKIAEARRIRKEEERLAREAEAVQESSSADEQKPIEPQASNTVVMNTVVMNNYGDANKNPSMSSMGINSFGQLFDSEITDRIPAIPSDPQSLTRSIMQNAIYGEAADTLIQGDPAPELSAKPSIPLIASSSIDDDEWVATESEQIEAAPAQTDDTPFPFGSFVFGAICCLVSVIAMILGLRYGFTYFVNFGKENVLMLLFSVLAIAFSPFVFRFGFNVCSTILHESGYHDDEE